MKESEKTNKFLDLTRELKQIIEHEDESDSVYCWLLVERSQNVWKVHLRNWNLGE